MRRSGALAGSVESLKGRNAPVEGLIENGSNTVEVETLGILRCAQDDSRNGQQQDMDERTISPLHNPQGR